jgi:hypothetical protein
MPNAIRRPILIFVGDEGVYNFVDKDAAQKWAHTTLDTRVTPESVFNELKAKFSVYIIRKPYGYPKANNEPSDQDRTIQAQWERLLNDGGDNHVVSLPDPKRVVDVIYGILAKEADRVDYFEKELKDRQMKHPDDPSKVDPNGPSKIEAVLKAVKPIHEPSKAASKASDGKSKSRGSGGLKSISLLDESDLDPIN